MSKSNKTEPNEDFEVIEQIFKKYFVDLEHSVPRFQHDLFDLQNEYYKIWKNFVNANLLMQKEFSTETGFVMSENSKKILENLNEEMVRTRKIRDQISIATMDATKKNVKIWNDNASNFENLNRGIMRYWMSLFTKHMAKN